MICSKSYYKDIKKSTKVNEAIKAQMAVEFLCQYFNFSYDIFLAIILDAVNKNFKEHFTK